MTEYVRGVCVCIHPDLIATLMSLGKLLGAPSFACLNTESEHGVHVGAFPWGAPASRLMPGTQKQDFLPAHLIQQLRRTVATEAGFQAFLIVDGRRSQVARCVCRSS